MAKFYLSLVHLLVIILLGIQNDFYAYASRKHAPLLIEEEGSRRSHRPAECQFGKSLKELGSTWYADLGPPFGVMYCIKCECVGVQKKRRIVARVQCRNIKNECPKPTCDEPILLPGKCCKTCPGDVSIPEHDVQDISPSIPYEEEERSMKHFAALLTGRTSQFLKRDDMKSMYSTINPQNVIATGRFSFHKKNLYYSFYVSEKANRPRSIQFVDHSGNILEEHSLTINSNGATSVYQNSTGKICGVWRRVPRDYRRLLRDDQMNVILLWGGDLQAELALAGQIRKYSALSTELFSSLLEPAPGTNPEQMSGAGGTAIVSTISGVTSSIHITFVFNGVFSSDDIYDVPLNIRLESFDKKQIIIEDIQRVKKPVSDINVLEISSPVSAHDLRLLSRGRLTITIESKKKPETLRIQGMVSTRVACELYQTLLSPHNSDRHIKSSGMAWFYLNKDGALVYNVQTDKLNENAYLTLVDDSGKRRTELEDLTSMFAENFASGVVEKLGPRVLEPLYNNDLGVNIAMEYEPNTVNIRGRLSWRPVADARDSSAPILLRKVDYVTQTNIVGMAWLAVDSDCNLHYDITLTGGHNQVFQLFFEELPIEAPGAPVTRKFLDEFTGNNLEGFALGIPSSELAKLETSVVYIEIYSKDRQEAVLKAKLKSIKVPSQCLPHFVNNEVMNSIQRNQPEHKDNNVPIVDKKCYHSGRFYDEGAQWASILQSCTMCSCVHGRVKCDPIKCPQLKCKGESRLLKNECCPSCLPAKISIVHANSSNPVGCRLGDQFYSAGVSWHPYLPPNGFDECAVCTCDALSLEISCPRTQCPPLNCNEKDAYRPDKKACCKKCPENRPSQIDKSMDPGSQHDQIIKTKPKTVQEIISSGGCKTAISTHENGQEWHPVVASHGEQKCIQCRCKDGHISCNRKRCTRSVCNNRINSNKENNNSKKVQYLQVIEHQDECCNHQCRQKQRKHSANHKRLRKEKDNADTKNIAATKS